MFPSGLVFLLVGKIVCWIIYRRDGAFSKLGVSIIELFFVSRFRRTSFSEMSLRACDFTIQLLLTDLGFLSLGNTVSRVTNRRDGVFSKLGGSICHCFFVARSAEIVF